MMEEHQAGTALPASAGRAPRWARAAPAPGAAARAGEEAEPDAGRSWSQVRWQLCSGEAPMDTISGA